ncbi:MAG: hypothetical protein DRQ55_16735 [Planctomycetota bacterium]|nr:MAG: hypothetical protein DRQ55_16735 [Planctomycetota bacterium]
MREGDGQGRQLGHAPGGLGDIVQLLPIGVYRASVDGRLAFANAALLRLLGLDPANRVPPLDLGAVLQDELSEHVGAARGLEQVEDLGLGGTRRRGRVVLHRVDGGRRAVAVTERLTSDESGRAWLDGTVEERTGQGRPERLEEARRFETIGRESGTIAHDVNNLMTAIGGYASLLRSGLEEADERRRDVDGILEATARCRVLVERLLNAGQADAGPAPVLDVLTVVDGARGLLERLLGGRGRLELELRSAPSPVRMRACELEQVLINLVTNARDAVRSDGTIRLMLRQVEGGAPVEGRAAAGADAQAEGHPDGGREALPEACRCMGRQVLLSVVDDGEGMPSEVAERVFDSFYTTKESRSGTGLGLSTVRSIVERVGGDVRVVTRLGVGTRVDVWLPRAELD